MAVWQVRIEFLRVQTFLFAVPRLLDILGANTLLGETLRQGLYQRAMGGGSLAITLSIVPDDLPTASLDDPLGRCVELDSADADDPRKLYQQGVLARDGGHFQALFIDKARAEAFQAAAAALILQKLPGLRFEISAREIAASADESPASSSAKAVPLLALPSLQVCEESGRGIASHKLRYANDVRLLPNGIRSPAVRHLSRAVLARKRRGKSFREQGEGKVAARDIASLLLMAKQLPVRCPPKTFDELCAGQYLALIHADGNGVGDWSDRVRHNGVPKDKRPKAPKDVPSFIAQEARGEAFYHAMRVAVRRAVVSALNEVFKDALAKQDDKSHDPYRLLMLGGDDLLLVCRAEFALPFVRAYAQALDGIKTLPDCESDNKPLTVGVGVAIAKPSFPFHRLHQIAEALASSAKRLVRGESAPQASVVDWTICTEAWMDDVQEARQADVIRYVGGDGNETLALSRKPYFILKSAAPGQPTLESLLEASETLENMPRSQRRALASELRRGRRHAELCLSELRLSSPTAWEALKQAHCWVDGDGNPALWNRDDGKHYSTTYADAVELAEIRHLKLGDTKE